MQTLYITYVAVELDRNLWLVQPAITEINKNNKLLTLQLSELWM